MLLEASQSCEKLVESSENFVDDVLLEASQNYEVADNHTITLCQAQDLKYTVLINESFARLVTEEHILQNIESAIPTSTRRSTAWGVRVWTTWMDYIKSINNEIPPSLETITNEELNHWLARFVMEARNKMVNHTLEVLYMGLQRYIREKRTVTCTQGESLWTSIKTRSSSISVEHLMVC